MENVGILIEGLPDLNWSDPLSRAIVMGLGIQIDVSSWDSPWTQAYLDAWPLRVWSIDTGREM
jgi:hypothetical protein